ncbi:MAG: hypothetical protein KGM15_14710 [Pseudomonadota bacterium]|nr:hypothetical protein [Pseudomonadota bacterium]
MFKFAFTTASILTASLGLAAWGASTPALGFSSTQEQPRPVISSSGKVRYVFKNPNECAPSMAMAVWPPGTPTAEPLGYRCYDSSNGN